jgi:hypothetical protein
MHVVSVLLASPNGADHQFFQSLFDHSNWKLFHCYCAEDACSFLDEIVAPVVVADEGSRGAWKAVLRAGSRLRPVPRLIVIPNQVDRRLWAEVLNLGGYDLLPRPWDGGEVARVLSHAWLSWKREKEGEPARQLYRAARSVA